MLILCFVSNTFLFTWYLFLFFLFAFYFSLFIFSFYFFMIFALPRIVLKFIKTCVISTGLIFFFFSYLTDFSYFSLKVAGHGQNMSKMTIFKGGVDGFSYVSLISVILFSNQDHPFL
jgi:hypothetical protein